MHYAAPRVYATLISQSKVQTSSVVRARGHNHAVAKVSLCALHPACGSTSGRTRGRKEKNMDVSHPGFKCTPLAPDAT